MPQHDMVLDNGNGLAVRTDMNAALQALASNSSGPVEPTTKYANMFWFNTSTNQMMQRNPGNTAWVDFNAVILGDTLRVGGKDVIHVPQGDFYPYSLAFGDGLQSLVHTAGLEGQANLTVGFRSGTHMTTASYNTFVGFETGEDVTTGSFNTFIGEAAGIYTTTGHSNTFLGWKAGLGITGEGQQYMNVFVGYGAGQRVYNAAHHNIAVGPQALHSAGLSAGLTGDNNVAIGASALRMVEGGVNNIGIGTNAGGGTSTANGITSGDSNIFIGFNSFGVSTGSNNVVIGNGITSLSASMSGTLIIASGSIRRIEADNTSTRLLTTAGDSAFTLKANGGGVAIAGTNTNDNAAAGFVGEVISSQVLAASAVALTTGAAANVTSISLTDGDWDVEGFISYETAAATSVTRLSNSISLTTAGLDLTSAGASTGLAFAAYVPGAGDNFFKTSAGRRRISVTTTTAVYLVAYATFSASTLAAYGSISARRMR